MKVKAPDFSKMTLDQMQRAIQAAQETVDWLEQYGFLLNFKPHPKQELFFRPPGEVFPRCRLFVAGNRAGKSEAGALEAYSFAMGERLWDGSKCPVKVPNRGRIVATSYLDGIKKVIEPKIERIFPKEQIASTKTGQQGSLVEVRLKNGSWFDLVSCEQDPLKHEGADLDWVWVDETLSYDHWIANWRGLTDRAGHMWLTLTPLEQPWIKTMLYDGDAFTQNPSLFYVVEASIYDNVGYGLTKQAADDFVNAIASEEERQCRRDGKFRHFAGAVYKEYKDQYFPNGHLIAPFEIPEDWPRFLGLDPHDRTPTHALWIAMNPNEEMFVYDEAQFEKKTVKDIAEGIRQKEFSQVQPGFRMVRVIDPSATKKSDVVQVGASIQDELLRHHLYFQTANNDIVAGHKKVREALAFRQTLRGERPRLFFFDSARNARRSMLNYVYDDHTHTGKVKDYREPKENRVSDIMKHHCDCLRYVLMWNPRYPHHKDKEKRGERFGGRYRAENPVTGY